MDWEGTLVGQFPDLFELAVNQDDLVVDHGYW